MLLVVTIPPSPPVVIILSWQNDHAPISPIEPTDWPSSRAPCACAQSSITKMPLSRARSMMSPISQGQPAIWTGIIAFVFGVNIGAIVAALRLPLSGSTSAKTGVAPAVTTHEIDAIKVRGVTITSHPGPIPRPLSAKSRARVPLLNAMACLLPAQSANSFSNSRPICPVQ